MSKTPTVKPEMLETPEKGSFEYALNHLTVCIKGVNAIRPELHNNNKEFLAYFQNSMMNALLDTWNAITECQDRVEK